MIRQPHPVQVLIATMTDARHHQRSLFDLRRQQSVIAVVHCAVFHNVSAALRLLLVASYVFWVIFSVVYYVIDSFSLFTC